MCIVAMIGVAPVYFPMWGGLILGPKKGATEEEYYCESACWCLHLLSVACSFLSGLLGVCEPHRKRLPVLLTLETAAVGFALCGVRLCCPHQACYE